MSFDESIIIIFELICLSGSIDPILKGSGIINPELRMRLKMSKPFRPIPIEFDY